MDKNLKVGDTVYTINNETNNIESWSFAGYLKTENELLCQLAKGAKYCFLPVRCVFMSEKEAKRVIDK